MNQKLRIALPKGRLAKQVITVFKESGFELNVDPTSRVLIQEDERNQFSFMFVKPSDVVTYVAEGVCDIGFVGSDSIRESNQDIYELYDLEIGKCKMVIAGPNRSVLESKTSLVVASKYPRIATEYFRKENIKTSIIKLNGSVELGPLVGLSDVIVDIYETGNTLKANNLQLLKSLFEVSTKLISNKASYRIKRTSINKIMNQMEDRGGADVTDSNL